MNFGSDNESPAHPDVMQALLQANSGYATSYGNDLIMDRVRDATRNLFEAPDAAVYLVATGSTANALSLSLHASPWQTIYCHTKSHIQTDECNAPEFYSGGAKLTLVAGDGGKFTAGALKETISATPHGDVHAAQRGIVSITNITEAGTLYSTDQVKAISAVCKEYGLPLHMDGARFSNAVAAANCSPAEMTWKSGVDILSFGGTKNGLLGVEAVVMFNPEKAWEFELRRKRAGHLFSKHRFLSAQMQAYLQDDLWLKMARSANGAALRLSTGIKNAPGGSLMHPTEGNIIFANLPRKSFRRAKQAGSKFYFTAPEFSTDGPDDDLLSARLVCSWYTSNENVDQFLAHIQD